MSVQVRNVVGKPRPAPPRPALVGPTVVGPVHGPGEDGHARERAANRERDARARA